MRHLIIITFLLFASNLFAQQESEITLEDLWTNYSYYPTYVSGFNFQKDGKHFTKREGNNVNQYDVTNGQKTKELIDFSSLSVDGKALGNISNFTFSADEKKVLIEADKKQIYRHSYSAKYYVHDFNTNTTMSVYSDSLLRYTSFDPTGNMVAFVMNNNLWYRDLRSKESHQITKDGKYNAIINGATDWVYEEEFAMSKAFEWSPDSEYLAYMRFDESDVKEFTMMGYHDDMYPEYFD